MRGRRFHRPLFALFVACAAVSSASADQVVYFVNGKAIMVKSVEKGDKFTVLEMDGGGRMGVPTDQIARIEEYVVSAPSAPQPAAPVAPAAQAAASGGTSGAPPMAQPVAMAAGAPAGVPSSVQSAATAVPGPGVGGRSMAPNGGFAGLRPLDIGGNNMPPGAMPRPFLQGAAGAITPGPGNQMLGSGPVRRNNFAPGRPFQGRPGMFGGRAGRLTGQNPNAPAPAVRNAQPGQSAPAQPQAPSVQPPPPSPSPAEAPPPPDDSDDDSSDQNAPQEGEPSGDSPGSAS